MRIASRAALIPLAIIAPNVGPIRFEPSCSDSSIPSGGAHIRTHTNAHNVVSPHAYKALTSKRAGRESRD